MVKDGGCLKFLSKKKSRRKKKAQAEGNSCHVTLKLCGTGKADAASIKDTPHVALRQIAEEKIRGKEL